MLSISGNSGNAGDTGFAVEMESALSFKNFIHKKSTQLALKEGQLYTMTLCLDLLEIICKPNMHFFFKSI